MKVVVDLVEDDVDDVVLGLLDVLHQADTASWLAGAHEYNHQGEHDRWQVVDASIVVVDDVGGGETMFTRMSAGRSFNQGRDGE
eukprot:960900-Amphidinium_carterae.1